MQQREMVSRNVASVQYTQGRAVVRYRRPAEVIDVRYLPRPESVRRHRKPAPEWLMVFGLVVLFRIMPAFLVLALLILIVRPIVS